MDGAYGMIEQLQETIKELEKDIKSLEPHRDEFHQLVSQIEKVDIVEDEEVALGGCLLISDFGRLDSRLETKLSQVDQIVRPEN